MKWYNIDMLTFKPFEISDIADVRPYLDGIEPVCTKAIGVKYMWAEYSGTEIARYDGGILVKDRMFGEELFAVPRGERREEGLRLIEEYVRNSGGELIFNSVDDDELAFLASRYPAIEPKTNRDYADYLYLAEDMRLFKGKKYHGQRNHINRFLHDYPNYVFSRFGKEDLPRIYAFLEEHKALAPRSKEELTEYACCVRLLHAFDELDLCAAKIEVEGKIVAISVGEIFHDTLIIHIEKALPAYSGVYPTMCNLFAREFSEGLLYINREDDAGDAGLRISKTQYHPVHMVDKRLVFCRVARRFTFPTLFTERLALDDFTPADMPAYAALATDEERNVYWGYDYKVDLGSDAPDAAHFARVLAEDEGRGVCYSRKIADTSGRFVGEAVLYNFRLDGSAELGLRIASAEKGKGYGREMYRAVADAVLPIFGTLHARCFKANDPSRKMILAAGFTFVREDDVFYYFKRN